MSNLLASACPSVSCPVGWATPKGWSRKPIPIYLLSEKDVIKDFYDGLDDITDEKNENDDE